MEKDSIVYTQQFTYAGTGKLEKISENRSYYHRITTAPFSVTNPSPQTLYKKVSSLFDLKYSSSTGKLESTNMKSGPDGPGVNFDTYADTKYEYSGDNVSKVVKNYGPITAGVPGAATRKLGFEYNNYDANINPFTLLPFEYKVTRLIDMDIYLAGLTTPYLANEKHPNGWMISPNNPKRLSITDLAVPVPTPTFFQQTTVTIHKRI
ncbi:hypothetical protein ACFOEQ_19370 [Chryseobacterium arachidis]|uniref:hypothetical protein n=1 Tax=Chryseobacterium arachidis TaxID=1416778 RepID=UPI0036132DE7